MTVHGEGNDSRKSRRYNVKDLEVFCTEKSLLSAIFQKKGKNSLPVINFSMGGAQFLSKKALERGSRVRISLARAGDERVTLDAEVCWCQQIPRRSAFLIGVEFDEKKSTGNEKLLEIEADIGSITLRLVCPKCKSALGVKKRYEGSKAFCPKCNAPILVRDDERLPELEGESRKITKAVKKDTEVLPTPEECGDLNREFVYFLKNVIRSQIHLEVIQKLAKKRMGMTTTISELSLETNHSRKRLEHVLVTLVKKSVVKQYGNKFKYDPSTECKRQLAELAGALATPSKCVSVLALIPEKEPRK